MSFTTPITVPLTEGLDLSQDAALGGKELHVAENVDFAVQGQVRGRPSRATPRQVVLRDPASLTGGVLAAQSLAATGLSPLGLMRHQDITGERALLGCEGRLLADDGTVWRDWGHFACARVDRVGVFDINTSGTLRRAAAQDFGPTQYNTASNWYQLLGSNFTPERMSQASGLPTISGGAKSGNSARCGTTTAAVVVHDSATDLYFLYRTAGGALTAVQLATDCAAPTDDGDSPSICCDFDQTVFFVAYQTTTANQYKVLRVSTTGTVLATYTGSLAGIHGHWVANSAVADNFVVIGLTDATGLTVKVLNATTMADNAKDSTYVAAGGKAVVVGVESSTRYWWAFSADNPPSTTDGLYIGVGEPATAASATLMSVYFRSGAGGSALGTPFYTPVHQPLKFNGRMYLTIGQYHYPDTSGSGIGNWFTIDLSNIQSATVTAGGLPKATLVARGTVDSYIATGNASSPSQQPSAATLLADSTGWTFAALEWQTFKLDDSFTELDGQRALLAMYAVRMSGPRAVLAGGATLVSGSVPHSITGGQCFEAGFPGGAPRVTTSPVVGGGFLAAGSYTIGVCWSYVDGAGQTHRSAPTLVEQTVVGPNDYIEVYAQNPYITERPNGDVKLEVYCSEVNPTADAFLYLQYTVTPSFAAGSTKQNVGQASIVTTSEKLYTTNDEFIHVTPPADGGIAALGRRVWIASADKVFASLLLVPGKGATWNDEGSLQVNLPAGAGRVLALEGLDDKLVIFCERGVYAVQDGGPDNTGSGPDIPFPIRLTDLGCAGPRSTCVTDRGVVFCSPLDSTDPQRGGPWLLDRSLSLTERKYLGTPALDYFLGDGEWVPEVAFSPERQQLYVSVPAADSTDNSGVVVVDMRQSKWSTWSASEVDFGALRSLAVVAGVLWDLRTEPAAYNGEPGSDEGVDVQMRISTSELFSNGTDGLGWSRVRAVSALCATGNESHELTIVAVQDRTRVSSATFTVPNEGFDTTWPATRGAPEFRLPVQKCSSLRVELRSFPATARWTAVRLEVQPLPGRAPASQRS